MWPIGGVHGEYILDMINSRQDSKGDIADKKAGNASTQDGLTTKEMGVTYDQSVFRKHERYILWTCVKKEICRCSGDAE